MEELRRLTTSKQRIALMHESGLYTLKDVIAHLPYRYEEFNEKWPADEEGKILVEGYVADHPKVFFKGRLSRLSVNVEIYGETYNVTIFNRHFLVNALTTGKKVTIIGKMNGHRITASQLLLKDLQAQEGMHPVYSLKEGLTNKMFSSYVKKALSLVNDFDDFVPIDFHEKHHLVDKKTALYNVHFPANHEMMGEGMKMLKYEEFLKFEVTMQYIKMQREQSVGIAKTFDHQALNAFLRTLPFTLTKDQQKAVLDILADLQRPRMMYRFLQGDVGSGKTVVSSIALYANYLAGYQGALMAPTEVLAAQHYETLHSFFKESELSLALLTGSMSTKEKEDVYTRLANGEIDVIVGTHALFQEKVEYSRLGLVITDEQHRFGVKQRKALKEKGESVDFLVMSATPIPRTLALSLFGDMDVSEIHALPSGRKEKMTKYVPGNSMKPFLKDLLAYLASGGQVYVICPMINEQSDYPLKSVTQVYEAMSKYFQGKYHVGLLHGGLSDEEKNQVMNDFHDNKVQILVSTTVIEVGIDVKNANMMVIYDAERFGLSQIHQLRGRIGRGDVQGRCYLLSTSTNKEAIDRLRFVESTNDGYEISKYDLKIRGPGEVLGQRQSGVPSFVLGDIIKDFDLLKIARDDARALLVDYYKYGEYKDYIEIVKQNIKTGNEYVD